MAAPLSPGRTTCRAVGRGPPRRWKPEPGGGRDPRCWLNGSESLQVFALLAVTAVCLLSIFYANMLSESLQDARSGEIQKALVRLTWVMQKKSAVGMQRVEEFIHREFEELVELGWLKLKPAEG